MFYWAKIARSRKEVIIIYYALSSENEGRIGNL